MGMNSRFGLPGLLAPVLLLGGCGFFGAQDRQPGTTVAAQYDGLAGRSVAIVVYVQSATVNEFPGVREEVANFVAAQLRERLPTVRLLRPADVINWQVSTLNWQGLGEKEIARRFSVDRVLYIEVLEYDVRRTLGYGDMQGRLRALCKVFEAQDPGNQPNWSGVVDVMWPPNRPLDPTQTNASAVRLRTLESFAAELVKHFHEYRDLGPSIRG